MKHFILGLALSAVGFTACNNNTENKTTEGTDTAKQEIAQAPSTNNLNTPSSTNKFGPIITKYIQLKNALTADDGKGAADAARSLGNVLKSVDKSGLKPDELKNYEDIESDMQEHAEHIAANAANITHQREHFVTLSKDVYDVAKAFGAGQTLYHDFCPMYDNNKGAYWLSETKDIKNPYLGTKMSTCGEVREELK